MRDFRKPLIMMTPKSLLRHKLAVSSARRFHRRQPFPPHPVAISTRPPTARRERLVLCSGKLAYELMEARDAAGDSDVAIVRIEQLYPFPSEPLAQAAQGACPSWRRWSGRRKSRRTTAPGSSSRRCSRRCLADAGLEGMRPRYAGRDAARLAGDRPRQAPRGRAGGLDRRRRWAIAARPRDHAAASGAVKEDRWPPKSKFPTLGESITEGTLGAMAEEARRSGRGRRADRQPRNRQGRGRSALAGRRRAGRAAGQGRRHGRGRRGDRADRRGAALPPRALRRRPPPRRRPTRPAPARTPQLRERRAAADRRRPTTMRRSRRCRRRCAARCSNIMSIRRKIKGTGKDGRLTKDDVLAAAEGQKAAPAPRRLPPAARAQRRLRAAAAPAARRRAPRRARQDDAPAPDHRHAPQGSAEHRRDADHVQRRRHDRGDRGARAATRTCSRRSTASGSASWASS